MTEDWYFVKRLEIIKIRCLIISVGWGGGKEGRSPYLEKDRPGKEAYEHKASKKQ